jgi:hypothetical protein
MPLEATLLSYYLLPTLSNNTQRFESVQILFRYLCEECKTTVFSFITDAAIIPKCKFEAIFGFLFLSKGTE